MNRPPRLALTQGDPAGIGPEILLKLLRSQAANVANAASPAWQPILVAERAALEALRPVLADFPWDRLRYVDSPDPATTAGDATDAEIPVLDPVRERRRLDLGRSGPADAFGAMAALDAGIALVRSGAADA
ncbi:MAG TPA: hypothetical protein VL025_05495, partial [Thermoanaerobaculia bacterium]|nr:hypothetical protein [Thermoanaerobaculia bacterium]